MRWRFWRRAVPRATPDLPTDLPAELAPAVRDEARRHPGGHVYAIRDDYDPDGRVPFHAIKGWWKVDEAGHVTGPMEPNPDFDPKAPRDPDNPGRAP